MAITMEQIKDLRKRTGAGVGAVKSALEEAAGNEEKAIEILRKAGLAKGASRAGKSTDNGLVFSYVHAGGAIGVLVEISAETDFASRSDDFQTLGKDIALHIAASKPEFITSEEVPQEVKDKELALIMDQLEGKPEEVKQKMSEGKLQKYYEEVVLLEQKFVKDDSKKVKDLLAEALSKMGENVQVVRFARFEIASLPTVAGME